MPVGHIEVPAFGEWLYAPHVGGKIRQVGGPQGSGAFEHGDSLTTDGRG
jgi:hypothetical protein